TAAAIALRFPRVPAAAATETADATHRPSTAVFWDLAFMGTSAGTDWSLHPTEQVASLVFSCNVRHREGAGLAGRCHVRPLITGGVRLGFRRPKDSRHSCSRIHRRRGTVSHSFSASDGFNSVILAVIVTWELLLGDRGDRSSRVGSDPHKLA